MFFLSSHFYSVAFRSIVSAAISSNLASYCVVACSFRGVARFFLSACIRAHSRVEPRLGNAWITPQREPRREVRFVISVKETDAGLASRRAAGKGKTVSHWPLVKPRKGSINTTFSANHRVRFTNDSVLSLSLSLSLSVSLCLYKLSTSPRPKFQVFPCLSPVCVYYVKFIGQWRELWTSGGGVGGGGGDDASESGNTRWKINATG